MTSPTWGPGGLDMKIRTCLFVIAAAGLLGAVGCSSSTSARSIRHDLTPELTTLTQRPADIDNMKWHTWNMDWRQMKGDFYRGAHLDRPTRLAPNAIPH
ncbi:MAG: hypothetical protein HBSAPP03_08720 [Phycisphaerae bacterium]|nr:MAG: hypothetical protein HBSAPP03_08720 [Phycisphaerae bacterium]